MANSMEKDKVYGSLIQSQEANREKNRIITTVVEDKGRRDQEISLFRNENLQTYTEVSLAQFVGHRAKPEWKRDYQYNVFDPITRDKVMAIVSKSAGMYEAQFFNTKKRLEKISATISTVLGAFYADSARRLNEVDENKATMIAALIRPKAIRYEGWKYQRRTIQEIVARNEYGDVTETSEKKIVHYNGPYSELCNVEDIIAGSLKIRNLQEQPRFAWVPKMQMDTFRRKFPTARFPEAAKVRSAGKLLENDMSEFLIRNDLKENEVEVLYFFEKWDDRLSIIANGVLLTQPKKNPMPFAHKDYPFVWGGFELLAPDFIYDMPLPIKILDMQDVDNEVLSLTLDMVWRGLNEVVLVKEGDDINDDELYGGGLVPVNDPSNFQKLEFGSSFGMNAASSIMDRVKKSIESSSLDAPSSGQTSARHITAREVMAAREAAIEISSLFLNNMESMERDKARLRVQNQLDRYHRPVDWEKRIGKELTEEAVPIFREISVRDGRLDDGRRGKVNIRITEAPRTRAELNDANIVNDKELSQTIDVSPEIIREIEFDVEIVPGSSVKRSKTADVSESRMFLADANSMPDLLSRDYAAKKYVEALGEKPDEALAQNGSGGNPMKQMAKAAAGKGAGAPVGKPPGMPEVGAEPDSVEGILNQQM